jgi:pyruvate formate lyase activating enzyme
MQGIIFNIQRFSVHDGPGIRTTVFLKGCPLNCRWCSNPESRQFAPQLMIRNIKCAGCGECVKACPENVISFSEDGKRCMNWNGCTQCFECVSACLYGALSVVGESMRAENVLEQVEKDIVFYNNSGGGITISGGEPLAQHEFLEELLPRIKNSGLHVALDTTGYAQAKILDRLLPFIDLVLLDIKHTEPARHKKFTGVENTIILENAKKIAGTVRTWFRVPLIKGFNDSKSYMEDMADFAVKCGVDKISLLPYHAGGVAKEKQIGPAERLYDAKAPDDSHIAHLIDCIKKKGVKGEVGR